MKTALTGTEEAMLSEILSDFATAWRLGNEVRNPNWYLIHGFITARECLALEQLSNAGGSHAQM
jgi:hypothetical protein